MLDFENRNMEKWSLSDTESRPNRMGKYFKDKYFHEIRKQLNFDKLTNFTLFPEKLTRTFKTKTYPVEIIEL